MMCKIEKSRSLFAGIKPANILFVLTAALFLSIPLHAQISPGDLTTAHAKLEGLKNCTACHELGQKITNEKCLDCHKEIKLLIEKKLGYHSSPEVSNKLCSKCHSEHNGRSFQIVRFDTEKFNHSVTGFVLYGKHAETDCGKCHRSKFIMNPDLKKRKNTYLGLDTNCANCHEDFHQNTLGKNCANCHNTSAFKPAPLFNHDKTKFRLTGLHKKVECEKCHKTEMRGGKKFTRFAGLAFGNCTSCHSDFHKGKFGTNCESCHSTAGFKKVRTESFDHGKTGYPLLGKHTEVKCAGCHGASLSTKPSFKLCTDCHKDYHKGQFTVKNKVRDCADCHTVNGFKMSTFTIEMHNAAKFPLTRSHLAVSCNMCHKTTAGDWNFVLKSKDCSACHKNVHGSEISVQFMGQNKCENCHNTDRWGSVRFDHSKTKFALTGKHAETSCRNCHEYRTVGNEIAFRFASLKSGCESCHNDIHLGQFNVDGKSNCQNCHGFENWKPAGFDHEKTSFSLKGAHSKLKCVACHKPAVKDGKVYIKFKLEEFKCATCHSS